MWSLPCSALLQRRALLLSYNELSLLLIPGPAKLQALHLWLHPTLAQLSASSPTRTFRTPFPHECPFSECLQHLRTNSKPVFNRSLLGTGALVVPTFTSWVSKCPFISMTTDHISSTWSGAPMAPIQFKTALNPLKRMQSFMKNGFWRNRMWLSSYSQMTIRDKMLCQMMGARYLHQKYLLT